MSVLYVDSLQPNLGSGVHIAGHVLQVVTSKESSIINNSSTSLVEVLQTVITPKYDDSKLIVTVNFYAAITEMSGGPWALGDFEILDSNTGLAVDSTVYEGGAKSVEVRFNATRTAIVDSVSTAPRTFSFRFRKHGGTYGSNVSSWWRTMTIMEIAQ